MKTFQSNNTLIPIGGVFRCCLTSISKQADNKVPPYFLEGNKLTCEYCTRVFTLKETGKWESPI